MLHGLGHHPQLAVELGELEDHVYEARVELDDLLVDRDGFMQEPLVVIEPRDLEIGLDRVLFRALLGVEVADLEPDPDVLGVLVNDAEVLLDRLVDLTLVDKLARRIHDLFFVKGHGPPQPPGAKHHTNVLARGPSSDGSMPRASLKGYGLARRWVKEIHERIPCLTRAGCSHLITGRSALRAMRSGDRSQLSVGGRPSASMRATKPVSKSPRMNSGWLMIRRKNGMLVRIPSMTISSRQRRARRSAAMRSTS